MGHPVRGTGLKCRLARAMVVVFVLVTAALSLAWSHSKLMSQDEMYAFQTYSVRSVAELVQVQRTEPISLDPLLYPLLVACGDEGVWGGAFALRLPALLGFLLMQVCLFFFVRRLAGERAGVVAAAFPALTATLFYSAEGRPYGLMLGLYALALLSWQCCATHISESRCGAPKFRAGMGADGAGCGDRAHDQRALLRNSAAGSVVRGGGSSQLAAAADGLAGGGGDLRGDGGVRGDVAVFEGCERVPQELLQRGIGGAARYYACLPVDLCGLHADVDAGAASVDGCVGGVCGSAGVGVRAADLGRGGRELRIPVAEWVLMLVLAALPFCGYLLARFVTHSIEVRYVLGAAVAISAMVGVAIGPWLRRDGVFAAVMVALGVAIVGAGAARIHAEQQQVGREAGIAAAASGGEVGTRRKPGWAAVHAGHGRLRGGPLFTNQMRMCARA